MPVIKQITNCLHSDALTHYSSLLQSQCSMVKESKAESLNFYADIAEHKDADYQAPV